MKSEIIFFKKILLNYPQLLNIPVGVWRKNITAWLEYQFKDGESKPPKAVIMKVNNICNMNCKMCNYSNNGYFTDGRVLSEIIFQKVIDDVYKDIPVIAITGGEPLINNSIIDYLNYIKEHHLICSMVTNGWFLQEYAQDIVESGLDILAVSIDGPGEVHDQIRRKEGAYKRAMAGIKEIAKYDKRPLLFVNSIIQADNYTFLNQLVGELEFTGIDAMNINLMWIRSPEGAEQHNLLFPGFQVGEGWIDESLLEMDFTKLEQEINQINKRQLLINFTPPIDNHRIRDWYTNPMSFLKDRRLLCPWMWAIIFQDGTMRMCDDIVLGDLGKDDFWDIWNEERIVNFRRTLKEKKCFPICSGCCNLYRNWKI